MVFVRQLFISGCLSFACSISLSAFASDDYLKMLEGEAQSVTLDRTGQLENSSARASSKKDNKTKKIGMDWGGYITGDNFPPNLKQDEFEVLLESSFIGTYLFYRRLNSNDRSTVYHRYSKGEATDIQNVRKTVTTLLKH